MTDEIVTRWFRAEYSSGEVYGVYKARFQGTTYIDEQYWYLGGNSGWSPNSGVRDWFFIGKDSVWVFLARQVTFLILSLKVPRKITSLHLCHTSN